MRYLAEQINHPKSNALKFAALLMSLSGFLASYGHVTPPTPAWIVFAVVNTVLFLYFTPTLLAMWCNRPGLISIAALNTLLGASGAGWVAALAWALYDPDKSDLYRSRYRSQVQNSSYETQQLRRLESEIEACKKQIDELRQHIILIDDHQSYAYKMIEGMTRRK